MVLTTLTEVLLPEFIGILGSPFAQIFTPARRSQKAEQQPAQQGPTRSGSETVAKPKKKTPEEAKTEADEEKKRSYIEKYIPHIGIALQEILGISDKERDKVCATLKDTLERSRS